MLNNLEGPDVCREAEYCVWTIDVFDEILLFLILFVTDGSLGMWGDPEIFTIHYTPLFGSTTSGQIVTFAVAKVTVCSDVVLSSGGV